MSLNNYTVTSKEDMTFRKLFPKLDKVIAVPLIREIFQTSKRDAAEIIKTNSQWFAFFNDLESRLQSQEKDIEQEVRNEFGGAETKQSVTAYVEKQKLRRKYEKAVKERFKALELCREVFIEMGKKRGENLDPDSINLADVEGMLKEDSGEFREHYNAYMVKMETEDCLKQLRSLAERGLLQVNVGKEDMSRHEACVNPEQISVAEDTHKLIINI